MTINLYFLYGRCGTDLLAVSLHLTHKGARKTMGDAYKSAKKDLNSGCLDGTSIGKNEATIATADDWWEWRICKFTLAVSKTGISISE